MYLNYFRSKLITWNIIKRKIQQNPSIWQILQVSIGQNAKNIFSSSRWYAMFISEVGFSSRKTSNLARLMRTRVQSAVGSVSRPGCLFCIRFKQTHNDKPLCSSPLSPSRLVGVSRSPLCSSCLTTYNYVVGATRMDPCRRKKAVKQKKQRSTEISLQGLI